MGAKLEVTFAGHVQPWLTDMLAANPTGAARFVADFAASVAEDRIECSDDEDEFLGRVETLCALADVVFVKGVAQSVYKGYISPGEYAMGLRKTWQTREEAAEDAPRCGGSKSLRQRRRR